jgi:ribonuclease D
MPAHPELINTAGQIQELASKLKGRDVIAFDTEFIRESTFYPIVEIIQVATDEDSWIVDAQAFKKGFRPGPRGGYDPGLEPLLDIFRDKSILKIVHAAQGDQECLYTSFGAVATPSLDTAVAASLCGLGDGIGLSKLLKAVMDVDLKKGHARTNWSVRPLPEQLVEYAHADVVHLVQLGRTLLTKLDEVGRRAWALELSAKWEDPKLYESDIEGLANKLVRGGRTDKRGYAALVELLRWREERVRHLNLPRRWVADDAVMLDLAHVRPKDMAHLSAFRGLNKGELKNSGEAILAALKRASETAEVSMPKLPKPDIPSPDESQVLDLLRCYVGILADQHRIAVKHLMTASQLLPLLRNRPERPADLVAAGLLGEEASRLIGAEIIAMIKGERALTIRGKAIEILSTGPGADSKEKA